MNDRFSAAAHERALQTLSTSDGALAILAIDHRDSLRVELSPDNPDSVSAADITQFKIDVVRELAPYASAVMLESEYSLPQIIDADVLPGSVGFLAALEAQGYLSDPGAGPTTFLDDFGAEQAKRLGASAAKLLLHYNPSHREHADAQRRVVETAVEMCRAVDLPLLLEPMFYDLADPDDQRLQVIAAARDLGGLGVDVLKMPFPIHSSIEDDKQWADACEELDEACAVPWALLSAGVGFGQYLAQLRTAVAFGCSGFTAGRALWREALAVTGEERSRVLREEVRSKFLLLTAAARRQRRAWDASVTESGLDDFDLPRWFGVRSFVHHDDAHRFEERVVTLAAPSADVAMDMGLAESAEYAQHVGGVALDAVQVFEIASSEIIESGSPGLIDGLEVYSQLHGDGAGTQAFLAPYFAE